LLNRTRFHNIIQVDEVFKSNASEVPTLSGIFSREATKTSLLPLFDKYTFTDLKIPTLLPEPTEIVALETLMCEHLLPLLLTD
jgi:hypothetical protein